MNFMENLADYSSYVSSAYAISTLIFTGLAVYIVGKYWAAKQKVKKLNEKSS